MAGALFAAVRLSFHICCIVYQGPPDMRVDFPTRTEFPTRRECIQAGERWRADFYLRLDRYLSARGKVDIICDGEDDPTIPTV